MNQYRPILFNTEMVKAILDGRKTVTRRYPFQMPHGYNRIKGLYRDGDNRLCAIFQCTDPEDPTVEEVYARYQPGDILWVRETWHKDPGRYMYKANYADEEKFYRNGEEVTIKWRPSIHLPREAARLFLRVTNVKVEQLRKMVLADVLMEGVHEAESYEDTWRLWHQTWNSTIKTPDLDRYCWQANPWVWVIKFERISKEEAQTAMRTRGMATGGR